MAEKAQNFKQWSCSSLKYQATATCKRLLILSNVGLAWGGGAGSVHILQSVCHLAICLHWSWVCRLQELLKIGWTSCCKAVFPSCCQTVFLLSIMLSGCLSFFPSCCQAVFPSFHQAVFPSFLYLDFAVTFMDMKCIQLFH
jgi:hypothetical protein